MKVRINTHGNPLPESHGEWVDLYTAEDTVLEPLGFKIISLGVAMELPAGYYAQVVPRSSTCKNFGIIMANSVGIATAATMTSGASRQWLSAIRRFRRGRASASSAS